MEVRIKNNGELVDATIEMVDGVMVVSPKFEPKNGDVLSCVYGGKYQGTFVLEEASECAEAIFHFALTSDGEFIKGDGLYYMGDVDDARPATEEEKKKLFDKLAEEGYEFDFEKKELVKLEWKPKLGDGYWRVDYKNFKFFSAEWTWKNSTYEIDAYNNGYVFRTDEECQELCNRLNDAINSVKP